jgi:hypothetical protein
LDLSSTTVVGGVADRMMVEPALSQIFIGLVQVNSLDVIFGQN